MPRDQRRSRNEMPVEPDRPLSELEKIEDAALKMSTRLGKPLSQDRISQLTADLAPYPVEAIEYALDAWGRNAKMLPALADLLGLLRSYMADKVFIQTCGKCDTGWVKGFKDKAGNDAVKRCECISR